MSAAGARGLRLSVVAFLDSFQIILGPDGPILLQDHHLIEQMAQFNRECIPERASRTPRAAVGSAVLR